MTRQATATLMIGPKAVGPWADRIYAPAAYLSLIEGGSSAYWTSTFVEPKAREARPNELVIECPEPTNTIDALLVLIGAHLAGPQSLDLLKLTHNVTDSLDGTGLVIAPFWELADEVRAQLGRLIAQDVRLAATLLDEDCLLSDEAIRQLLDLGLDVEVYRLASATNS